MKKLAYGLLSVLVAVSMVRAEGEAAGDANDPAKPHESGIYYYSESGGKTTMTKIESESYGQTKGGFAFFGGYGQQSKVKAVIEGAHAAVQVSSPQPTFYFYFEKTSSGLSENVATKPEDFVLEKMDVKKDKNQRRVTIGKSGWYSGTKSGADKKAMKGFTEEKISPGVFKVTITQDLPPGEYCFFRPIAGAGTIFGFGVPAPSK